MNFSEFSRINSIIGLIKNLDQLKCRFIGLPGRPTGLGLITLLNLDSLSLGFDLSFSFFGIPLHFEFQNQLIFGLKGSEIRGPAYEFYPKAGLSQN